MTASRSRWTVATGLGASIHPGYPRITSVCILVLVVARQWGSGPYGGWGVPFLLGLFVAIGVMAGRAAAAVVSRAWPPGAGVVGVAVGAAASVAAGATWNATPTGGLLLVRLFALSSAAALGWALSAAGPVRRAATAAAWAILGVPARGPRRRSLTATPTGRTPATASVPSDDRQTRSACSGT